IGLGIFLAGALILISKFGIPSWTDDPSVAVITSDFLSIRLIGLLFFSIVLASHSFYVGIAETTMVLVATLLMSISNIFLDYALIFGNLGFPEMGYQGAALATLISEILSCVVLLASLWKHWLFKEISVIESFKKYRIQEWRPVMKLSLPLMFQQVMALTTWTVFFFLVEKLGGLALKVSHLLRNFYMLAFVITMGIGQTTRTYVSGLIAEKRQSELRKVIKRLIIINLIGVAVLCHGYVLYPTVIASWFFESPEEIEVMVKSMKVISVAITLFCFGSVWLNAIEGAGRTKIGFWLELTSIAFYLCLVYWLTQVSHQPIHIVWMSDYLYFGLLGGLSGLFLLFGNWKNHTI
ncbi:MAG: polysaccharide biosynthesis C-terminal domain-containing protein, partial [Flavobacteriales bacterium]|nr:polysaccharide biosynthesis C-terminal domain-containing protein [Flavobacteriales bacterium]